MTDQMPTENVVLLGNQNSGKTTCTKTLRTEVGLEVFYLALEPGVPNIIGDMSCEEGIHYCYIPPADPSFDELYRVSKRLGNSGPDATQTDNYRSEEYQQFLDVVSACRKFVCHRCGGNFGSMDEWTSNRAVVLDSLSALSKMAMHHVCGPKPNPRQAEWGSGQNVASMLIDKLVHGTEATFVMTAHTERKKDEVYGGEYIGLSGVGQKMPDRVTRPFDEVILCEKDKKGNFTWNLEVSKVDTKTRSLPFQNGLEQSFGMLFNNAKKKREG